MTDRIDILKTYKMYIDGKFPRSESGRTMEVRRSDGKQLLAHACRASRKDLRDAVEAARRAQPGWQSATPYLRGQILYRIAEMVEGKRDELSELIDAAHLASKSKAKGRTGGPLTGDREVTLSVDRLVHYAGWADKYSQVLGCNNPVSGPFYNFTIAEPTGVVAVVAPDEAPLLALVSLLAPASCSGNTVVALASDTNPLPAMVLAEACATGDVPAGVINLLSGDRAELLRHVASHRDLDAVHAGNLSQLDASTLRAGVAENLKRVTVHEGVDWQDVEACQHPWWIEPMVEFKTVWHPSSV